MWKGQSSLNLYLLSASCGMSWALMDSRFSTVQMVIFVEFLFIFLL